MATYAIGDVQACLEPLERLLGEIGFSRSRDRLWFVGDLVNRGPDSAAVVRFVRDLGERAVVVQGNHDLHLLALAAGHAKRRDDDTFDDLLAAPDRDELLDWLRFRPMLHVDGEYVMVHAGLLPAWSGHAGAGPRRRGRGGAAREALPALSRRALRLEAGRVGRRPARHGSAPGDRERDDAHALLHRRRRDGLPGERRGGEGAARVHAVVRRSRAQGPRARRSSAATGRRSACASGRICWRWIRAACGAVR